MAAQYLQQTFEKMIPKSNDKLPESLPSKDINEENDIRPIPAPMNRLYITSDGTVIKRYMPNLFPRQKFADAELTPVPMMGDSTRLPPLRDYKGEELTNK